MNQDLSELVRESLQSQGCDPNLLSDFDSHSTISLDFSNIPSILISQLEDFVLVWTQLAEFNANTLESCSARLLNLLMEPSFFSLTGQMQIIENDGHIVLKTILKPSVLNVTDFSNMLEEFYHSVEKYLEAIR